MPQNVRTAETRSGWSQSCLPLLMKQPLVMNLSQSDGKAMSGHAGYNRR